MKKKYFHISLYIIIPFIFSGIACFSAIIAYRLALDSITKSTGFFWSMLIWLIVIVIGSYFCGLVLVRLILRPIEEFMRKTEELPVLANKSLNTAATDSGDELKHFEDFFEQVTDVLSKVEARELFPQIIGQSKAILGILSRIKKVSPTDTTVLIFGESGTGKELVATSIYEHSLRKRRPLIKINCAAIPEGLMESELFGHEKGAFTGAVSKVRGKFEIADRGTIFLDEIGDMPLTIQAKVLRVIQEKEFERVGSSKTIKVDIRFIAATNMNLEKMVEEGTFREDLFFRLNVYSIKVPPLRNRTDDIPFLANYFLKLYPDSNKITPEAMEALSNYSWPGNVRELQNTIEQASIISNNDIDTRSLPTKIRNAASNYIKNLSNGNELKSIDEQLTELERRIILDALIKSSGVQVKAAELLGINQRSLWHRIKKFNIDVKEMKNNDLQKL
ncbi:sigma-54 interaction domain-containing protein [Thermodesulfobacteriota bacterium]